MVNKHTQINFILPFKPRRPAGGFKVMYEYANRLAKKGYKVHLTYPIHTPYMKYRFPYPVRRLIALIEGFGRDKWFSFDPRVTMSYVSEVSDRHVIDADVVISTWWSTAREMGKLSPAKGRKINLIQGFENWEGQVELLYETYNMGNTTNVVVASYLRDIVAQHTQNPIVVIPNAIDTQQYFVDKPITERVRASICMLYSIQEIKGSDFGLESLKLVKEKIPELRVELFGVCPHPSNLPDWITFTRNPDNLPEIYNRNSIFISNSFTEGMALTPLEAMFCGCALVCTDIQGHSEYALDKETALLFEVKNVEQLAQQLIYLIEHDTQRIALAQRGEAYVQRFSWDNAFAKMEQVVKDLMS